MKKAENWPTGGGEFAARAEAVDPDVDRATRRGEALREERRRILAGGRETERRGVVGDTFETERGLSQHGRDRLAQIDRLLNAPGEVKSLRENIKRSEQEKASLQRELEAERVEFAKAEKRIAEKKPETKKASISKFSAQQLTAQLEASRQLLERREKQRSWGDSFKALFGKKPALEDKVEKEIKELEAELKVVEAETLAAQTTETDRLIRRGAERRAEDLHARLADVNDRLERARKDLEYQLGILKNP